MLDLTPHLTRVYLASEETLASKQQDAEMRNKVVRDEVLARAFPLLAGRYHAQQNERLRPIVEMILMRIRAGAGT